MKYVCVRKNKVAVLVCGTLIVLVLAAVTLASLGVWIRGIFEAVAMLLGVAAIQVAQRYMFSSYEFVLDPDDELINRNRLTVIRVAGQNRTSLVTLPMSSLIAVKPYVKRKKLKEEIGGITASYSFCTDMLPSESYILVFDFGGENTVLRLQCDKKFASELEKRMGV